MADVIDIKRIEALGPADILINALLAHSDHMVHNRPGIVVPDAYAPMKVKWEAATYKEENGEKIAYFCRKVGKKSERVRAGVIGKDGKIREPGGAGGRIVGEYRQPGFFPEVAEWMYRQIATIYKLDNDFVAHWASYAFGQEHKDLKVALCAFLLVQNRRGDPVVVDGKVVFHDEDYRDIGEAMCLIRRNDNKDFNPKLLLRVGELLRLPQIAAINRELGFGQSAKNPAMGRWEKAVARYLRHRERNVKMLEGLVKSGQRTTVMALAQKIGYKPETTRFFQTLRWKQEQSKDGRRSLAIGEAVSAAESWEGMTEAEICQRIIETKPSYKRIVGLLPSTVGVTRAIVAAAVEAGSMSDQDIIIAVPTLEDLGLVEVEPVKSKLEKALKNAENQRAANIASRVKSVDTVKKLEAAADTATKKAVEQVMKGLRVYFMVDISGSMNTSLDVAKEYVTKLLGGFPADKIHISVFNSSGRELVLKHPSREGVEVAFRGISANGGTDYGSGIRCLEHRKLQPDEDALLIYVGDNDPDHPRQSFAHAVRSSGLHPAAMGLIEVPGRLGDVVDVTCAELGIPVFRIDKGIFNDAYAIPRTLRNLIAATPVAKGFQRAAPVARVTLVETILKTPLLNKPTWASVSA